MSLAGWWHSLQLARQFVLGSALVLLAGMLTIGWWVSNRIRDGVTDHTAQAAALYMAGTLDPLIQELVDAQQLSSETIQRIDALLEQSPIREQVTSLKVWNLNGTIVYSKWKDMIGRSFPPSSSFTAARGGGVAAEFDTEAHEEDVYERAAGEPLVEIYAPVRAKDSLRVIAVSEFYSRGEKLEKDLREATLLSWLVVAGVALLMLTTLSGIVYGGSRTIDHQRRQLTHQIGELEKLLAQNEELRQRLQQSNFRIAESNERILQRVGADLHDGPAQLLSFALLRLNKVLPPPDGTVGEGDEIRRMTNALKDTLAEIRNISTGLSLPRLGQASLHDTIVLAVALHEDQTGSKVELQTHNLPDVILDSCKVCAYRFVQEALTNAYRHGRGRGQRVMAEGGDKLVISVSDEGPGFRSDLDNTTGLGLTGMRARVEAIGGELIIEPNTNPGARLTARFDSQLLKRDGLDHAQED
jgi:signal transduction histidine kinase